ncbi:hypothetical protein RH915_07395 [Serpentinicella sp. ANB-PHB4]|uniref:hypothetical protein n=1 Tax=Serpentinicella sp. ANB-PHB4 TaxID=3074076 RepID=UPI00285F2082|nr:hypothetical protein [Serpentinicella sp. ANB-PHB4]MDR5659311.1 hypothetical protein [Serpentinicella sp. ANB-PHB4]
MKNKVRWLVIVMSVIILSGCMSLTTTQRKAYDDDQYILQEKDNYTFTNRSYQDEDENYAMTFDTFYGVETLWEMDAEAEGKLFLEYESNLKKGSFRCVLVTPENEVITLFDGTDKGKLELDVVEGKSWLKIVGKDAGGAFAITINKAENIRIETVKQMK